MKEVMIVTFTSNIYVSSLIAFETFNVHPLPSTHLVCYQVIKITFTERYKNVLR